AAFNGVNTSIVIPKARQLRSTDVGGEGITGVCPVAVTSEPLAAIATAGCGLMRSRYGFESISSPAAKTRSQASTAREPRIPLRFAIGSLLVHRRVRGGERRQHDWA